MEQQEHVEQESEAQESAPKEIQMEQQEAAPSLEGLVKMKMGDAVIHAHPTVVGELQGNGWNLV